MRDFANLLFGRDGDILSGLFGQGDRDEFSLAEQARRAGEWCGATPRRGSVADALGGGHSGRGGRGDTSRSRGARRTAQRDR